MSLSSAVPESNSTLVRIHGHASKRKTQNVSFNPRFQARSSIGGLQCYRRGRHTIQGMPRTWSAHARVPYEITSNFMPVISHPASITPRVVLFRHCMIETKDGRAR